jgi:hypothetical protein
MFTHARWAAGLALIAVLAAGCGTGAGLYGTGAKPTAAAHSAAPMPAATHHHHHHARPVHATVTTPPASPAPSVTAPATMANPIPQGNGGDQDADNNGGPSDGDGNI